MKKKSKAVPATPTFVSGSSEMAVLTREFDWNKTPVGSMDTWPQSLRTTLGIILKNKYPMFLFWGAEQTCFYNDAYRPSLGNDGKHPGILGMAGKDAWPEIWAIIKPLIDQVLNGGDATWNENALIPIYRNGKVEDVYWTFSYSPVLDENDTVAGVLVTCNETTQQVVANKTLEEVKQQLHFAIESAELGTWDYNPATNRFTGNDTLKEWHGLSADEEFDLEVGLQTVSEIDRGRLEVAMGHALQYDSGGHYNLEYTIVNMKTGQKRIVRSKGKALFNSDKVAYRFNGVMEDVTQEVNARTKVEESEKRFRKTVQQAPVGITILRGKEFLVEMANEAYLELVDRKEEEFVGKRLFDALPEVESGVSPLLTDVMTTGKSFHGIEFPVNIKRNGEITLCYFNFIYDALREENGEISGIIVVVIESTQTVKAKHALAESEKHFRSMVMQSPIPMTIFRGRDFVIEMANKEMFEKIWRKKEEDVIGKKLLDVFPELNDQKYPELLREVYTTKKIHRENEAMAMVQGDTGLQKFYLDFEYSPLQEPDGTVSGLMVTVNDVTEKVVARQFVEENESRLNILIDASELGTWELDIKTDKLVGSDRYRKILGFNEKENIDHATAVTHVHPDDMGIRAAAFEQAFKNGKLEYSARLIYNDQSLHWIDVKGKVFYDEKGNASKILGTLRDITDEKFSQQLLEEREQKFRLLADSMPQFVWTGDAKGNLNYFNQSVYFYTGMSEQEVAEGGWLQIVHPDDRDENVAKWMHSISTGDVFNFEHRFKMKDGHYRWQLSRAIPQRDAEGNIQMWVGTSTDIQDQKIFVNELEKQVQKRTKQLSELNEALVKSEERYHLMVEEVQDYAILYLNREGIVENWNQGAEKIKGYTSKEIIGKSFSTFYTAEDKKINLPATLLKQAVEKGKALQEGWRVKKDGTLFWASVVITAVHDKEGNVIGFSKVTHDLTDKKAAEDKLKENAVLLEQQNRDLDKMNTELKSFAYVSSHDLQEPLRKIQTFSNRLVEIEGDTLTDTAKDYLKRMQEAAARMQTLIEDLLSYSRTNSMEKVYEKTDLNILLDEIKGELRETLAEKNATIERGDLGELNIIPFQFRQLLNNLIGNSLKFARQNEAPVIKINSNLVKGSDIKHVAVNPEINYYHLSVKDNGIGFDSQYKEKIFEVFQRLHGRSDYKGTGIGLAIVKKIIDNHNGIVSADSETGKGAIFNMYIPINS